MIRYILNKIREKNALSILKNAFSMNGNYSIDLDGKNELSKLILIDFKNNLKNSNNDLLSFISSYSVAICALSSYINSLNNDNDKIFRLLTSANIIILEFMKSNEYLIIDEVEKNLVNIAKDSILYKMSKLGMFDDELSFYTEPEVYFDLAIIYFNKKEYEDGYKWLKKSFNNGYWRSLEPIYLMYLDGVYVEQSYIKSYAYLSLYISILSAKEDASSLQNHLREISLEMTSEEILEAKKLFQEYLSKYMTKKLYID